MESEFSQSLFHVYYFADLLQIVSFGGWNCRLCCHRSRATWVVRVASHNL